MRGKLSPCRWIVSTAPSPTSARGSDDVDSCRHHLPAPGLPRVPAKAGMEVPSRAGRCGQGARRAGPKWARFAPAESMASLACH